MPRGAVRSSPSMPPTTYGRYRVDARIGSGGMGDVFRGFDTRLDRPVALKVMRAALAERPTGVTRFHREARAASALNHPHIAPSTRSGKPPRGSRSSSWSTAAACARWSRPPDWRDARHRPAGGRALGRPTPRGSSTATSSPRTSWSRPTATSRCSTSAWSALLAPAGSGTAAQASGHRPGHAARHASLHVARAGPGRAGRHGPPTSSRWASSCTSWPPADTRSGPTRARHDVAPS